MTPPQEPPRYPPKPRPGDRVAVVSPSSGLPELFPLPFDLGLARLQGQFHLEPVEYPTTRKMGSSPRERAEDLHAAFADPTVKAVIASIGGDDRAGRGLDLAPARGRRAGRGRVDGSQRRITVTY
ncbi:LD-carboxypeptidase [Streptomyces sp. YIM 121038]|nr:LD-carboxypeptidase [Streptomyces sp. YIM 121038]